MNTLSHPSAEEKESIIDANKRHWKRECERASNRYKCRMNRLDAASATEEERMLLADFRRDDSYLGHPSPHHIIYKLGAPLVNRDGSRAYEFLIEYDVYEPSVGIYYGCKCLTLSGNHDEQIRQVNEEWESLRGEAAEVLNATFPGKQFFPRFKFTDNANNNTYWPFWITLYEEEDIVGVAVRALHIIKKVYQSRLGLDETAAVPELGEVKDPGKKSEEEEKTDEYISSTVTAFTESARRALLGKLKNDANREVFEKFLSSLLDEKRIHRLEHYEYAFAVGSSSTAFAFLVVALFEHLKAGVPWKYIGNVFMSRERKPFGEGLKTMYSDYKNNKDEANPTYKRYRNEAAQTLKKLL